MTTEQDDEREPVEDGSLCQRTAPEMIFLQVSDDRYHYDEEFPANDGVTWCRDSVLSCEVRYVRADLARASVAASPEPVREPVAREETCRTCKGSGDATTMTQCHGPDDYEVTVDCPECGGTGATPVEPQLDWERARAESAEAEAKRLRDALAELVACKDLKGRVQRLYDDSETEEERGDLELADAICREWSEALGEYERRRTAAWESARTALAKREGGEG